MIFMGAHEDTNENYTDRSGSDTSGTLVEESIYSG